MRFVLSQIDVILFKGRKKALDFGAPGQWRGVLPGLLALGDGERPVKQVAQVREDLGGRARFLSDVEAGEMVGSTAQGFAAAVGDGGDRVAKKLASGIGCCGHGAIHSFGKSDQQEFKRRDTECAEKKENSRTIDNLNGGKSGVRSGYCLA